MEQGSLFNDKNKIPASKSLVIGQRKKEVLSQQQQTFNRLVKRIEKLRKDLDSRQVALNTKLDFYSKYVYPVKQQLILADKESVKLLFSFFRNKKFIQQLTHRDRKFFKEAIAVLIEEIFSYEKIAPDDELMEIFTAVQGFTYEEAAKQDFSEMKAEMEKTFRQYGFDVNLDDLHSDMTEEEVFRKLKEKEEEFRQHAAGEQHSRPRKKTKKQLEAEEREKQLEEARSKNISKIYKQLAKVFHPDLEQDSGLKLQKEELMKQLTNAYENNDLHTLLKLELSWIQKEENDLQKLSDEKLSIYNQVLKEQVAELETEVELLSGHPRYQPLHAMVQYPDQIRSLNLALEKATIENLIKDAKQTITELQANDKRAMRKIKELIRFYEEESAYEDAIAKFYR